MPKKALHEGRNFPCFSSLWISTETPLFIFDVQTETKVLNSELNIADSVKQQSSAAYSIWKKFLPTSQTESPWLFHFTSGQTQTLSYKDMNAQAHCVAAFLIERGLEKGEPILVLSENSLFALTVDLGVQFAGGVVIFVPPSMANEEGVDELIKKWDCRFVFVESVKLFVEAAYLQKSVSRLLGIILQEENTEDLPETMLSTFDRIVSIGKGMWRENMPRINARKESVKFSDLYCLSFRRGKKEPDKITYGQFSAMLNRSEMQLKESGIHTLLSFENPSSLHQRVYGYFAPLSLGLKSYCNSPPQLPIRFKPGPEAIIISPETLSQLHMVANQLFTANSPVKENRLKKAETLGFKRKEILKNGGQAPLGIKISFFIAQKSLFSKVRKMFGKPFRSFLVDEGPIEASDQLFFENSGYQILKSEVWG